MSDKNEDALSVPILEEAADWMDRQDDLTPDERAEFRGWLAASPAHVRAYDLMRHAMLDTALLDASRDAQGSVPARLVTPRRLGWAAAAGLALAAALLVIFYPRPPAPVVQAAAATQDYTTRLGQRADWRLADNSHLFLNADSKVGVQYLPGARNLSLARGEAIFEVAKDPARPFHVMAHAVTVTAVGTMFGVDLMNDAVGVRVYHGVVTVARPNAPTLTLRKGDWLTLDGRLGAQSGHFDPATYQTWRADWLEADKMPLSYVVAKLNRYSATPIVIGDAVPADAVLTGRFHLSNTDATLKLIGATLDIAAVRREGRI
ncbi:MAG TPA: FecR domain-containing protein, partial [Rhizomicrobium sp.]